MDTTYSPNVNGRVRAIIAYSDGSAWIGGDFTQVNGETRNRLARLDSNGALISFLGTAASVNGPVFSLAENDGSLVFGGSFTEVNGVARNNVAMLNRNAALATTFDPNANDFVSVVAVQPGDGKVLLGGNFTTIGGQSRTRAARVNMDSTLDTSFDASFSGRLWSMALQADGKINVAGEYSVVNGVARNRLVRLLPNGALDSSFVPSVDGQLFGLTQFSDGKLSLGGSFNTVNGQARQNFARISVPDAAAQSLSVAGSTAAWIRSGSSPELTGTPRLQISSDGQNFSDVGILSRTSGGWRRVGLVLPPVGQSYYLRVRGQVAGGISNGSKSIVESTALFFSASDMIFANGFD